MGELIIDSSKFSADELQPYLQDKCHGKDRVKIQNISNHRFALSGFSGNTFFDLYGDPGNCFANLLDGPNVRVHGDCEDDICDSMHSGHVAIDGNVGDIACQAMQGGSVYVKGDTGNRTGMQMREYGDNIPYLVIGGNTGDFLGEYMAGGTLVVLNLSGKINPVGFNTASGMIGGRIYVRGNVDPERIGFNPDSREIVSYLSRRHLDDPNFEHCRSILEKYTIVPLKILKKLLAPGEVDRLKQLFYEPVPELRTEFRMLNEREVKGDLGKHLKAFSSTFSIDMDHLLDSEYTVVSVE